MLVVAMVAVVLVVGTAAVGVTGLVVAHRRAQGAADLSALAAAGAWRRGQDPCAVAGEVADRNGARLRGCELRGADVLVRVAVRPPDGMPWPARLVGTARAGPDW